MATGKRYYWMKLKDSFMTSDTVDYIMSMPDGANYVVIYQMLCLKTINTDGRLSRQIGEVIIPYDVEKIRRDLKWFSADTIRVALNIYKQFGLIYEDVDGVLRMSDHEQLVGSESDYADQKKAQRRLTAPVASVDNTVDNGVDTTVDNVHTNVHTEIRDKEIRDKDNILVLSNESTCRNDDVRQVVAAWNELGLTEIKKISLETNRGKMIRARLKEYGTDAVIDAINRISKSAFLRGQNSKGWTITFDWFVKPNNFIKVAEGNYDDGKPPSAEGSKTLPAYTRGAGAQPAPGDLHQPVAAAPSEFELRAIERMRQRADSSDPTERNQG